MLRITNTQFEALQSEGVSTFEAAMIERCEAISPLLSAVLGKDGLLAFVQAAMKRAESHGFTFTGPVRLFIELSFILGSGFDTDAQYPWAQESLGSGNPETQIGRARTLHERSIEALGAIRGPESSFLYLALPRLQALLSEPEPPALRTEDVAAVALAEMARVYPEKHAFVGEPALQSLIAAGVAEASANEFSDPQDVLLVVLLMFAFGQGCTRDPIYPWMARALLRDKIPSPSLRAGQLKDKAVFWIRAVLANKGVRS